MASSSLRKFSACSCSRVVKLILLILVTPSTKLSTLDGLIAWVARSDDLDATRAATLAASGVVDLGVISDMRRGDYHWRMAVPIDGRLKEGGCLPLGIQWLGGAHPTDALPDLGVRLESLSLIHPDPKKLGDLLDAMGAGGMAVIEPGDAPALTALLTLPDGRVALLD